MRVACEGVIVLCERKADGGAFTEEERVAAWDAAEGAVESAASDRINTAILDAMEAMLDG